VSKEYGGSRGEGTKKSAGNSYTTSPEKRKKGRTKNSTNNSSRKASLINFPREDRWEKKGGPREARRGSGREEEWRA